MAGLYVITGERDKEQTIVNKVRSFTHAEGAVEGSMEEQSPDHIARQMSRVGVVTPWGYVEGDFHHMFGQRLSDVIRRSPPSERYLLLTNVKVRSTNEALPEIKELSFLLINVAHVGMIMPLQENVHDQP